MTESDDLELFPWELVKEITFKKEKFALEVILKSGDSLTAKAKSQEGQDEFIREVMLHLDHDRVHFE